MCPPYVHIFFSSNSEASFSFFLPSSPSHFYLIILTPPLQVVTTICLRISSPTLMCIYDSVMQESHSCVSILCLLWFGKYVYFGFSKSLSWEDILSVNSLDYVACRKGKVTARALLHLKNLNLEVKLGSLLSGIQKCFRQGTAYAHSIFYSGYILSLNLLKHFVLIN